jgi:hypothetical protein
MVGALDVLTLVSTLYSQFSTFSGTPAMLVRGRCLVGKLRTPRYRLSVPWQATIQCITQNLSTSPAVPT